MTCLICPRRNIKQNTIKPTTLFHIPIPKLNHRSTANKPKTQIFSSTHREPKTQRLIMNVNPNPSDPRQWWRRRWVLFFPLSNSLSPFPAITGFRVFFCVLVMVEKSWIVQNWELGFITSTQIWGFIFFIQNCSWVWVLVFVFEGVVGFLCV